MLLDEKPQIYKQFVNKLSISQEKYKQLVDKLLLKCQEIHTENERNVLRINTVKKMIRCRERDLELLKRRLDTQHDSWRSLPMVAPHPKRRMEQKRGPKPKKKANDDAEQKQKKVRRQRVKKNSVDKSCNGLVEVKDILEQTRYKESQVQQLLMMQQRQINLKKEQLL